MARSASIPENQILLDQSREEIIQEEEAIDFSIVNEGSVTSTEEAASSFKVFNMKMRFMYVAYLRPFETHMVSYIYIIYNIYIYHYISLSLVFRIEVVSGVLLMYGEIDTAMMVSGNIDIVVKETLGKAFKRLLRGL